MRKLLPHSKEGKKKGGMGMGMMAGLMDAYESAERGYKFKATASAV